MEEMRHKMKVRYVMQFVKAVTKLSEVMGVLQGTLEVKKQHRRRKIAVLLIEQRFIRKMKQKGANLHERLRRLPSM